MGINLDYAQTFLDIAIKFSVLTNKIINLRKRRQTPTVQKCVSSN